MIVQCLCATAVGVALLSATLAAAAETADKTVVNPNRTTLQRTPSATQPTASGGGSGSASALELRIEQLEQRIEALEAPMPALVAGPSEITVKDDEILIRAKRIRVIADGDLGVQASKSVTIEAQQDLAL